MGEPAVKRTIMVVDDNPLNLKLMADLLEVAGFHVLRMSEAESALQYLDTTVPDLIALDIRMPGIDGYEMFKRIRANPRFNAVKVVAVTASVMAGEKVKLNEIGFDACFDKPIDTKQFVNRIKALLP